MMQRLWVLILLLAFSASSAEVLLEERFDTGMENWWVEGGRRVWVEGGRLHVNTDVTDGQPGYVATVWHREPISGDVKVSFDAHVVSSNIHANNINLFLFYSDPEGRPLEESAAERANAVYDKYHSLNGYIFTFVNERGKAAPAVAPEQGAARTRIRRCPGFELLTETRDDHRRANRTYHFQIARRGTKLTVRVDGELLLSAEDPQPHRTGLLGLRTFRTHLWWDNIKVERLTADIDGYKQKSSPGGSYGGISE
jgi:hypothetical protein